MHFADQVFFAIFYFYLFFNVNDSGVPIQNRFTPEQVVYITFLNSLLRLFNDPVSISSLVSSNEFVLVIVCLIHSNSFVQIWRMSDLIYRPEEEVLAELEKFKSHVVACASKSEK